MTILGIPYVSARNPAYPFFTVDGLLEKKRISSEEYDKLMEATVGEQSDSLTLNSHEEEAQRTNESPLALSAALESVNVLPLRRLNCHNDRDRDFCVMVRHNKRTLTHCFPRPVLDFQRHEVHGAVFMCANDSKILWRGHVASLWSPEVLTGSAAKLAVKIAPEKQQQYAKTIFEESVKLEKGLPCSVFFE